MQPVKEEVLRDTHDLDVVVLHCSFPEKVVFFRDFVAVLDILVFAPKGAGVHNNRVCNDVHRFQL